MAAVLNFVKLIFTIPANRTPSLDHYIQTCRAGGGEPTQEGINHHIAVDAAWRANRIRECFTSLVEIGCVAVGATVVIAVPFAAVGAYMVLAQASGIPLSEVVTVATNASAILNSIEVEFEGQLANLPKFHEFRVQLGEEEEVFLLEATQVEEYHVHDRNTQDDILRERVSNLSNVEQRLAAAQSYLSRNLYEPGLAACSNRKEVHVMKPDMYTSESRNFYKCSICGQFV
jgi:beta-xylosidase